MPHIDPSPQLSVLSALLLVVLTLALRWRGWPRAAAAAQEAGVVAVLFAAWQVIGSATHGDVSGAHDNALAVWRAERALHLPSELALQHLVTPHPWLVQLANGYYLYGHLNAIGLLLAWVWFRHRDQYRRVRLQLCLLTSTALLAHLVPVSPPRLVGELGFTDVALQYGQSVYGTFDGGLDGQLLAMPSMHVGWAVFVAYVVVTSTRSRWRWLAAGHAVVMTLVVVVTANHWWADAAAGALLVPASVLVGDAVRRVRVPRGVLQPA